jgi:hypothetical protein
MSKTAEKRLRRGVNNFVKNTENFHPETLVLDMIKFVHDVLNMSKYAQSVHLISDDFWEMLNNNLEAIITENQLHNSASFCNVKRAREGLDKRVEMQFRNYVQIVTEP